MAGSISWADYTGFICHPDHETAAAAFGAHLRSMGWRRLTLKNFRAPAKRLASFISALEGPDLHHDERQRIVKTDNTNLLVCPYVSLPEDFDRYLQDRISANTRQKIRRFLRKIDQSDELRFTEADSRTFERDIEILVAFWRSKWARRKGDRVDELASKYRSILHQARADDALFLPVLWRGSEPLGALASFVDREKKTLMFFVAGRDESCNDPHRAWYSTRTVFAGRSQTACTPMICCAATNTTNTRSVPPTDTSSTSSSAPRPRARTGPVRLAKHRRNGQAVGSLSRGGKDGRGGIRLPAGARTRTRSPGSAQAPRAFARADRSIRRGGAGFRAPGERFAWGLTHDIALHRLPQGLGAGAQVSAIPRDDRAWGAGQGQDLGNRRTACARSG